MNSCGECTYCCKVMAVHELKKKPGVWCHLVQIGKGCGDYGRRPEGCRVFECLWLQSELPADMRPDRIKAVVGGSDAPNAPVVVYIDPATPEHYKTNRVVARMIGTLRQRRHVAIVAGEARVLLPREGSSIEQWSEEVRQ